MIGIALLTRITAQGTDDKGNKKEPGSLYEVAQTGI
jgi:hypothetical protein